VGVLRPVLSGHVVLLPQVGVGHAGGFVNVHAGHGPADRAGRREGARKAEEDTRQLHAHPHQSEYPPFARACVVTCTRIATRGSRFRPTFADVTVRTHFTTPTPFF